MPDALLDRDAEVAALDAGLAAARAGSGAVLVVEGPAGIGKSSLLRAAAARARGMEVLRARAGPLEQDAPWGVARQLFEPVRRRADWDELATGAAGLAGRVLHAAEPEPALAGDAMHAAAHGLVWLAGNLAERTPTLVVVDDAHWADRASLRWLAQLARHAPELPLAILCAVRSGEPAGHPELLAELLACATAPAVRPAALGELSAEELVRGRLPEAGSGFARACHAVTGGNPFLLRALLGHLADERVALTDEVAARLETFGPEHVARRVERQLARLPAGAAALAVAFAVLGRGAPLRHAAQVAGIGLASAVALADALRAAGLLDGGPEPGLTHPLVAAALYGRLAAGERSLRHARAARVLAAEHGDPDRAVLHLLHTDPVGDPATVAALRAAAARAGARGAPEAAAAFLRRALDEPPLDPATAAAVRAELGLALAVTVEPEAPALLRDAVTLAASPEQCIEIALHGARALGMAGHFREAITLCHRGLEHADASASEAGVRLEAEIMASAWLQEETTTEARARHRRAVAERPRPELWRIGAAWEATLAARPADEALALLRPVFEDRLLEAEPDSLLNTATTCVLFVNDELDAVRGMCAALIDHARPRGWLIALAHASFLRSMALVRAGEVRDAASDARLAYDFKVQSTPIPGLLWSLHTHVDALTELGELDAADDALARAGLGAPPAGAFSSAMLLESRARLRLAQHRPADALADARDAGARWSRLGVRHPRLAAWRVEAAAALVALGDPARAEQLAREHVELAEPLGRPAPLAAGLRALARTGAGDRIALLERAEAQLRDSLAGLERVRVRVELGAALRRANRRADARRPLREALEEAERGGMAMLAARARDELLAAGARPRRAALRGRDALTPAEDRVVALAAQGLGNREIAERLYVTRRTVETHLTHAFQKLGLAGRAELAEAFADTSSQIRHVSKGAPGLVLR